MAEPRGFRYAPRPQDPALWRVFLVVLCLALLPFLFAGCASRPLAIPARTA